MHCPWVSDSDLDLLLADGWRHFGSYFFRDTEAWYEHRPVNIIPLRIRLADFRPSKGQEKIIRKNKEVRVVVQAAFIDEQKHRLFEQHKQRFKDNVPNSLYNFLSENPAEAPTRVKEIGLYDGERLFAVSFFDVGEAALSSIYAMFDPAYSALSPGIFTLLQEIEYGLAQQKQYLYLGYAYDTQSFYDYKKNFAATEYYDWQGRWLPFLP
jgi:arginine-tRNA-protein transferase